MKTRKKIIGAVAALMVAIIAAASTTFAWFTMNNKVELGDFTAQITAGSDTLLVAVTGVDGTPAAADFKMKASQDAVTAAILDSAKYDLTKTTVQDLIDALGLTRAKVIDPPAAGDYTEDEKKAVVVYAVQPTNTEKIQLAVRLDALTPIATQTTLKSTVELENETPVANTATNNYISFDVHFQATEALKIYLNDSSKVEGTATTKANVTAWDVINAGTYAVTDTTVRTTPKTNADATKAYAKNELLSINPANAMRVGFVDGTKEPAIWNPNFDQGFNKTSTTVDTDKHMNLAESWRYFTSNKTQGQVVADDPQEGLPGVYTAILDNLTVKTAVTENGFKSAPSTVLTTLTVNGTKSAGKLTVTIWLEGNDGDCFNAILASSVTTTLSFLGAK